MQPVASEHEKTTTTPTKYAAAQLKQQQQQQHGPVSNGVGGAQEHDETDTGGEETSSSSTGSAKLNAAPSPNSGDSKQINYSTKSSSSCAASESSDSSESGKKNEDGEAAEEDDELYEDDVDLEEEEQEEEDEDVDEEEMVSSVVAVEESSNSSSRGLSSTSEDDAVFDEQDASSSKKKPTRKHSSDSFTDLQDTIEQVISSSSRSCSPTKPVKPKQKATKGAKAAAAQTQPPPPPVLVPVASIRKKYTKKSSNVEQQQQPTPSEMPVFKLPAAGKKSARASKPDEPMIDEGLILAEKLLMAKASTKGPVTSFASVASLGKELNKRKLQTKRGRPSLPNKPRAGKSSESDSDRTASGKKKSKEAEDSFEDVEDDDDDDEDEEPEPQLQQQKKRGRKNSTTSTASSTTRGAGEQLLSKEELTQKKLAERKLNMAYKRLLKRQCFVCKLKMHQDLLNDHYVGHFVESPKCTACDKHSTNPSNYVTHVLSHLPSQFHCIKCSKWFRQPIAYKRHQGECAKAGQDEPQPPAAVATASADAGAGKRAAARKSEPVKIEEEVPVEPKLKKMSKLESKTAATPAMPVLNNNKSKALEKSIGVLKEEASDDSAPRKRLGRPPKLSKIKEEPVAEASERPVLQQQSAAVKREPSELSSAESKALSKYKQKQLELEQAVASKAGKSASSSSQAAAADELSESSNEKPAKRKRLTNQELISGATSQPLSKYLLKKQQALLEKLKSQQASMPQLNAGLRKKLKQQSESLFARKANKLISSSKSNLVKRLQSERVVVGAKSKEKHSSTSTVSSTSSSAGGESKKRRGRKSLAEKMLEQQLDSDADKLKREPSRRRATLQQSKVADEDDEDEEDEMIDNEDEEDEEVDEDEEEEEDDDDELDDEKEEATGECIDDLNVSGYGVEDAAGDGEQQEMPSKPRLSGDMKPPLSQPQSSSAASAMSAAAGVSPSKIKTDDSILSLASLPTLLSDEHKKALLTAGGGTLASAVASLALKPTKDLSACGTYKVKIQCRRQSNAAAMASQLSASNLKGVGASNDPLRKGGLGSSSDLLLASTGPSGGVGGKDALLGTPQKLQPSGAGGSSSSLLLSGDHPLIKLTTPTSTPSKLAVVSCPAIDTSTAATAVTSSSSGSGGGQLGASSGASTAPTATNTTAFECPECDKKFVSKFGLFQHYDQHPSLAVTCSECHITFEDHRTLIVHNTNVHQAVPESSSTAAKEKDKDKEESSRPSANKSGEATSGNGRAGSNLLSASANSKSSSSLTRQFQAKSRSNVDEASAAESAATPSTDDLSALPSIMTRTSRLTNTILNTAAAGVGSNGGGAVASSTTKPAIISSMAILNHTLSVKTSGFADLSFVDFSCVNFPRIAQNYCELWPRKLQNQSIEQQPLHNYVCDKCGFYFPCKASLELHRKPKAFAGSRLILKPDDVLDDDSTCEKAAATNRCELFMYNSKYLCYEKALDEIITKIEEDARPKIERENESTKNEFLSWFGLVNVNALPTVKPTAPPPPPPPPTDSAAEELELVVAKPKFINLNEKLLLKLREQMLSINRQFIVDLDKWKSIHSSEAFGGRHAAASTADAVSYGGEQYSHKIHLKPHVNLNRPLLIRSKKLKRNKNLPAGVTATNAGNAKAGGKSFFNAAAATTNGSGGPASRTIISVGKKRKLMQLEQQQKELAKKKQQQETAEPPRKGSRKNKSFYDEEDEPDEDEASGGDSADEDDDFENDYSSNSEYAAGARGRAKTKSAQRIPPPPKLFKAPQPPPPQITSAPRPNEAPLKSALILGSSPNSSILARASGMNNSLALSHKTAAAGPGMQPPKLHPAASPSSPVAPSKGGGKPAGLMPKLQPSSASQQLKAQLAITPVHNSKVKVEGKSKPPALAPPEKLFNNVNNNHHVNSGAGGSPNAQAGKLKSPSKLTKVARASLSSQSSPAKSAAENFKMSENLSLKCKFCAEIFKGQSEFFQHVIVKHPKMLKQRLNRSAKNSAAKCTGKRLNDASTAGGIRKHASMGGGGGVVVATGNHTRSTVSSLSSSVSSASSTSSSSSSSSSSAAGAELKHLTNGNLSSTSIPKSSSTMSLSTGSTSN